MKEFNKIKVNIFKRFVSITMALIILLGIMPLGGLFSYGDGGEDVKPDITSVDVTKTYTGPNELDIIYIEVRGENLEKLGKNPVLVRDQAGKPIPLRTIVETDTRLYYEIKNPDGIANLIVYEDDFDISGGDIPQVNGIQPSNRMVHSDEILTIKGNKFSEFKNNVPVGSTHEINFYNKSGSKDDYEIKIKDSETIEKEFLATTPGGPYRVEFKKTEGKLTVRNNYISIFTLLGRLDISDDIVMTPNQGAPGTYVTLEADNLIENMSVFFKRNVDDLYDIKNMAEFVSYTPGTGNQKHKYIFKVPNIEQGSYQVFLTNKVEKNQNPNLVINSSKTFKNNNFVIISDANKPVITEVRPEEGPATGVDAIIRGRNLISISSNIFRLTEDIEPVLDPKAEATNGNTLKDELTVLYKKDGDTKIGEYRAITKNDRPVDVLSLERKITGVIGNSIQFREGSDLKQGGTDTIQIRIPSTTDEETDPVKDVTLEMETEIKYQYEEEDEDGNVKTITDTITLKEIVIKKNGFTYEQLSYVPEIGEVTPGKIPVDGPENNYSTSLENMKIHISGKNFSVYRYVEDGTVKYKYPEVNIGDKIILNKNIDPDVDIKVLDKNGNEIDGTRGNDLGEKILVTIPKGLPDGGLRDGDINTNTEIWVVNPNRNEDPTEMGYMSNSSTVRFVKVEDDKTPNILNITPNTVTTEGEKGVKVTGDKFYPGIKIYINGEEIRNVKRNDTGTELTFDAPPRAEGYYQILVQNEEGGAEVYYPFTYTKTYTDPKITDFNPKKGTAKTLVTVTGQSLVLPNPLVADLEGIGINKLIGTRVLLGDQDVSTYVDGSREPNGLQEYISSEKDLIVLDDKGRIERLSDYYHSVILREDNIYYALYFDTKSGKIKLTDGDKQVYTIGEVGVKPETPFEVTKEGLKIDGKTLKMWTPYDVKDGQIIGNKVKVKDNNELVFEVPPMPREGYYDVTIINPDTKRDSKVGNSGFYYSFQPEFNPEIKEIRPNTGSTEGQYYINIIGDKFIDNGGNNKTSVTIGRQTVNPDDVEIAPDGKSIRVRVPRYPGNLEKETDMDRKTVAVVLVNPDGGSVSIEEGFTYIIPISHPKIDKLILNKGSAAGGESVIIEGSGFRFFEPYKDLNNNAQWDEGEPFTDLNDNEKWDDLRYWLSPELKDKYDELAKDYENNILPILPKVYFGIEEVAIKNFTAATLEVETPKNTTGPVEVYLVNNDYGTSNKVTYTYEASNPKINTILPETGRKQGNEKVEIIGERFVESTVNVIRSASAIEGEPSNMEEQILQLVQFGNPADRNISNRDIPIDAQQNSGRIRDRQTTVEVGNLTVKYDANQDIRKLDFIIEEGTGENKTIYKLENVDYDDSDVFLPVNLLKDEDGNSYKGYEYIKVGMEVVVGATRTTRLRIDRGYSPEARLIGAGHISLTTPSYYSVGTVAATVMNPDGGKAVINFEYTNPDSKPRIINITRDGQEPYLANNGTNKILPVNIKGGSNITITGSDFRDVQLIQVGHNIIRIEQGDILVNEPNRLVFKMPEVSDTYATAVLHPLVVTNYDKATASSENTVPQPIYIQFTKGESNPEIEDITPPRGPATGGNTVTIKGKDFRETMEGYEGERFKVYFNNKQVPYGDVRFIDYKTISVTAPPGTPGTIKVKIENPDGEISNEVDYTYASAPKITSIVDPLDPSEKAVISVVSMEGGDEIKLKGTGFMEGAKVYFAPKVSPVTGSEQASGQIIYIEGNPYILEEGTEGTDIEFINSETIKVKTPALKAGSVGVIVVNPDEGASPIYTNLTYGIPELPAPPWIAAELVYDRFIRVHWGPVSGAAQYEIFVVIDDTKTELVGSTELTSFAYSDLKPRTRYKFVVKAIGKYGSSKASLESETITTGPIVGPPDEDGGLAENTSMTKTGNTANVTIGSKDRGTSPIIIDLTRGALAGSTETVVSIPASVIVNSGNRNIQVVGADFSLNFKPAAFNVATIRENSTRADAGVRFTLVPDKGNTQVALGNQLSTVYSLDAAIYIGNTVTFVDYLADPFNLTMDYDTAKASLRRLNSIGFSHFNPETNTWQPVSFPTSSMANHVSGTINRLGKYTVVGSRR